MTNKEVAKYQNRKPRKSILESRKAADISPTQKIKVGRWHKGKWIETTEYIGKA